MSPADDLLEPAVPSPLAGDVLDSSQAGGKLIRGSALRLTGYLAMLGLSVVSAAVLTRHLGVSRFGQYTTVMSLVAVISAVTDSGMSNVGTREYATLHEPERSRMIDDLLGLRVALTLVGVVIVMIWSVALGYDDGLAFGALTASLATVALVYQHTLTIPLTAHLRLGAVSALELARQTVWVALLVVLAALGAGAFGLLTTSLVANLILIVPTALLARGLIRARLSFHLASWRRLLSATLVYSLATAVGTIYIYTAQILTSIVASHHQSGLFAVSFRVFAVTIGIPGLVVGSALPLLSRAARDDHDRLAYAVSRIFAACLIAGVGLALVMSAGSGFIVAVIAGPQYKAAAPVLGIQALAMIASFLVACWSFALLSLHLHRGLLLSNAAALVVSVVLTIVLAKTDGARGAAFATIAGEVTLAVTSFIALTADRPQFRPPAAIVVKVALAGGLAAAAALIPTMPSIVRAVVAAVVYGVVVLVTRALPPEFRELLSWRPAN